MLQVFRFLFLCVMVSALVCNAAHGQQALSAAEQKLENMAVAFEDAAEALNSVQDVSDADLVASRVAVDFLLLRNLHSAMSAMQSNVEVREDYAKSFVLRCSEARKTAVAAIAELQKHEFHGSAALPAAAALAGLMKAPLPPHKAAEIAMELKVNNMEMVVLLLNEARDTESAEAVASLVEYALACSEMLEKFAAECETHPMTEESAVYYARRVEDYHVDFGNLAATLKECQYYHSPKLRSVFETIPPSPPAGQK